MPNPLQKSLQEYLSKIKKPTIPRFRLPSRALPSSTSWTLHGCKHPRTPSFAIDSDQNKGHHNHENSATLSDIDHFLLENFKSLYIRDDAGDNDNDGTKDSEEGSAESSTVSSLMEEAWTSTTVPKTSMGSNSTTTTAITDSTNIDDAAKEAKAPDDFITLLTYSPSPYHDFRQSMQEIVEARLNHYGKVDWKFMEEVLLCYLNLNDKKSYKYILTVFVDLVVLLRENSGKLPTTSHRLHPACERRKAR